MRVAQDVIDRAQASIDAMGEWRTEQRILHKLGRPDRYTRTWIGSLPVYLGSNRIWVACSNWLLARPKPLISPAKVERKATDRLVRVKPKFIMPGEEDDA